jgi:type VI secretion system ImpA family protein
MTAAMTGTMADASAVDAPAVPARLAFADLTSLLAPVQVDTPAGAPLRYDPVYDRLRDARREDDATLPQGIWSHDLKRADWAEVDRIGSGAIVMRGKDLQIAAWLLESWMHTQGFAGVRQGFELLFGLCDRFWDTLHPLPEGTDFSSRTSTIEWVNQRLAPQIAEIPVTAPGDRGIHAWTWSEHEQVLRFENEQRRAQPKGASKPELPPGKDANFTSAAFGVSAEVTPRAFYVDAVEDLNAAIASARALGMLLDEWCGADSPSLTQLNETMTAIRDWMKPMAVSPHAGVAQGLDPIDAPPEPEPIEAADHGQPVASTNGDRMDPLPAADAASPTDYARSRADAYRKLADAAQTLMRIEPHSPTPYLVRRAIAWGGMSLAELMRHFIDSGYDLRSLYSMLGMDEAEEKK